MIRFLFAFVLLLHGLIHLMGFAKAFKYAEISQLTQPIAKSTGTFWGIAALLFVIATALFFLRKDSWWMVAAPAIVLSQILIFSSWQDAKFGTIANVIALIAVVPAYGIWRFNAMVGNEIKTFLPASLPPKMVVTKQMIAPLPPAVQKWLERSNAVGAETAHLIHLKQSGEMKTKPDGKWIPFTAEQYFTVDKPGFIWQTEIQAAPMMHIAGRDKYENGRGNMLIQFLSLFPIADAKGAETDQGSLLRYLAETIWFPSAALNDYIRWEPIDSLSAKAIMTYGGVSAPGIFRFNADGDVVSFEAKRYYDRKEGATLEDWFIENKAWKTFDGVRIPYQSEVTWKLKTGDYTWLKLEITEMEYNDAATTQ